MPPFVNDTATGTAGTLLSAHTGETGAAWTKHPSAGAANIVITAGGRLRPSANFSIPFYYASGVPASADYDVEADFYVASIVPGQVIAVCGRMSTTANTQYYFGYSTYTNEWIVQKVVAGGSAVVIGTNYAQTLTPGQTYHGKFQMRGTALTLFVDGVSRISATDSSIPAAGRVGVRLYTDTAPTDANGIQVDNIVASDSAVAPSVLTSPSIAPTTDVHEGDTLTLTSGAYAGAPVPTVTRQWKRAGADISGQTGSSYVVQAADVGQAVTCVETATNTAGSATGTSNAVTPVAGVRERLFKIEDSPWNGGLPSDAPIDAANSTLLASLAATRASPRGLFMEAGNYSAPIYRVPAGTTRVPLVLQTAALGTTANPEVADEFGTSRQRLAWRLQQGVPLTDAMRPALGTDGHLVVVDEGTGEMWDLFTVWRDGGLFPWATGWDDPTTRAANWGTGTWRCWFGGYIADHRENIGQFADQTTPAYQSKDWGATATSLPIAAGMILKSEMDAGVIPHALQLLIPNPLAGHNWPAQRDDGLPADNAYWVGQGCQPTVKEGTRLRLKASVADAVTTGYGATFDETARILRVALKAYGAIINDRTGTSLSIRAEPATGMYELFNPGGGNPWPPPYSDSFLAAALPAFTTSDWEIIDPAYRPGAPISDTLTVAGGVLSVAGGTLIAA